MDGKIDLEVNAMKRVWQRASMFVTEINANHNEKYWDMYVPLSLNFKTLLTSRHCDFVNACIRH